MSGAFFKNPFLLFLFLQLFDQLSATDLPAYCLGLAKNLNQFSLKAFGRPNI